MKNRLKGSRFLSCLYLGLVTFLMWGVNKVIPFKKNRIVFTSFSGRQFSDSPRAIYESIKSMDLYQKVECVWAFKDPEKFPEVVDEKVAINSIHFFVILATSRFWVANSSIERMVPYKPDGVYYINTWHGFPWKVLGAGEPKIDFLMKNWYKKVNFDMLTANGVRDKKIFETVFPETDSKKIYPTGLPRNDKIVKFLELGDEEKEYVRNEIKQRLRLNSNKLVILYAPTFRDGPYKEKSYLKFKMGRWKSVFSEFEILSRSHYNVRDETVNSNDVIDVSDYPDLVDLFFVADVLITDYSSIMFDFALMEKPILLYTGDFEEYKRERGVYFSRETLGLPFKDTEIEIIESILNLNDYNFDMLKHFNNRVNAKKSVSTKIIVSKINLMICDKPIA